MKTPILPSGALIDWYRENRRNLPWRLTTDPYPVWVSEVMLQQTRVNTAIPYYRRFLRQWPTIGRLSRTREERVLKLWEGLGYYARARNLLKAARMIRRKFEGKIPLDAASFGSLPGVGPYICAAVLSIAGGLPLPVVDGNVLRVATRYWGVGEDIRKPATRNRIHRFLQGTIPPDKPGDFNQALMELGALCCRPQSPACPSCPLQGECHARAEGTVDILPCRSPRPAIPHYPVVIAVILDRHRRMFVQKRPSRRHLGGLWEFPGGKVRENEPRRQALVRECLEELHTTVIPGEKIATVRHAYTHFRITLSVYLCRLAPRAPAPDSPQPGRWVTFDQLSRLPFPAANHKFFPRLKACLRDPSPAAG